ncbi:alpha/beta hydrolase-fold protein [Hydrogenophaga sp.]|uniref:alpha/beta hydrolase n=1 Tax=Hydrogenophaga sp. TaxID=1904254 RepID=UPI0026356C7C|nr:alpha/beta hydrolase-fold protein [Hydrogenophaga sp.]MCW5655493.1 alpha/beta hydrolase [Hydrogenophaga sp.]
MEGATVHEARALCLPFVQVHELRDGAAGSDRCWQLLVSHAGGPTETASARRLLVVLDGNLNAVPAALMQHTRVERGLPPSPPCTVVGVGYPGVRFHDREQRARDFLPALPPGLDGAAWQSGQADAFSAFLDTRLLPWLEAQQGCRYAEVGLFGHSFGGLFSLYKLLNAPGRFSAFFSISPSLWWADGWLLAQVAQRDDLARRCEGRRLYLGIGADEKAMPGDDAQRSALHQERDLQGRFARLVALLRSQGVCAQAETFAGEDHGSVVYPAMARAVRWLTGPSPPPGQTGHDHDKNIDRTTPQ